MSDICQYFGLSSLPSKAVEVSQNVLVFYLALLLLNNDSVLSYSAQNRKWAAHGSSGTTWNNLYFALEEISWTIITQNDLVKDGLKETHFISSFQGQREFCHFPAFQRNGRDITPWPLWQIYRALRSQTGKYLWWDEVQDGHFWPAMWRWCQYVL